MSTSAQRGASRVALVVLVTMLAACVSKDPAYRAIDKLEDLVRTREEAQEKAVRELVVSYFTAVRERLSEKIDAAHSRARYEIYRMTEERAEKVAQDAVDQLEKVVGPVIEDIETKLAEARKEAETTADRAKEYEYAAMYGATLTAHARESFKLVEKTRERFRKERANALALSDMRFGKLRRDETLLPDVNKLTEEAMTGYRQASASYEDAMELGLAEVRRFIETDQKAFMFLAKGLLGDKIGGFLGSKVEALGAKAIATAEGKILGAADDLQRDAEKMLGKAKVE